MYFCPKCSYILDITKVENSQKEIKKSLSNVSTIIKMILADDNLDEYNFNVDINVNSYTNCFWWMVCFIK